MGVHTRVYGTARVFESARKRVCVHAHVCMRACVRVSVCVSVGRSVCVSVSVCLSMYPYHPLVYDGDYSLPGSLFATDMSPEFGDRADLVLRVEPAHCVVWYGMLWCGVVWVGVCGMVWYGMGGCMCLCVDQLISALRVEPVYICVCVSQCLCV